MNFTTTCKGNGNCLDGIPHKHCVGPVLITTNLRTGDDHFEVGDCLDAFQPILREIDKELLEEFEEEDIVSLCWTCRDELRGARVHEAETYIRESREHEGVPLHNGRFGRVTGDENVVKAVPAGPHKPAPLWEKNLDQES